MDTIESLTREAADAEKRAADSWERSDTDGFLTQFAAQLTAQLARRKIQLLQAGKTARFTGLYQGQRRVKAKMVASHFKGHVVTSWLLHEDEADLIARRGKRYVPTSDHSRILKDLGLHQYAETRAAWACIADGRGSAFVKTFATDDEWGQDAQRCND